MATPAARGACVRAGSGGSIRRPALSARLLRKCLLVVALIVGLSSAQPDGSCRDPSEQRRALVSFYNTMGGPSWRRQGGWLGTDPCSTSSVESRPNDIEGLALVLAEAALPDHCCWVGVLCCLTQSCPPGVTGPSCDCDFGLVTALTLSNNNLTGQLEVAGDIFQQGHLGCSLKQFAAVSNNMSGYIPQDLDGSSSMTHFVVGRNFLTGSIPEAVAGLQLLEVLDVSGNMMTGELPQQLCHTNLSSGSSAPLRTLLLDYNDFSGVLNLTGCDRLDTVSVDGNNFYGNILGRGGGLLMPYLQVFNAANNSFSGSIPYLIRGSSMLYWLDLSNNQLDGKIPGSIGDLLFLRYLWLRSNLLTGTIPSELFASLGYIFEIDISDNILTGTLPGDIGQGDAYLRSLDFHANPLGGAMPDSVAKMLAQTGTSLNARGTFLSCCGLGYNSTAAAEQIQFLRIQAKRTTPSEPSSSVSVSSAKMIYSEFDKRLPVLPPSVTFSKSMHPTEFPGISCPYLIPAGQEDTVDNFLQWQVDPAYWLFQNCTCAGDATLVVSTSQGWVSASCDYPESTLPWYAKYYWIWILVAAAVVLLQALCMVWCIFRRGSRLVVVQYIVDARKRMKGPPMSGRVSIVVTDIEGFSSMMKLNADATTDALRVHNHIIRIAQWANFGAIIEQEGDSYTVVFHEALDAVKFCLQAQLLLEKQAWPHALLNKQASHSDSSEHKGPWPSVHGKLRDRFHEVLGSFPKRRPNSPALVSTHLKASPSASTCLRNANHAEEGCKDLLGCQDGANEANDLAGPLPSYGHFSATFAPPGSQVHGTSQLSMFGRLGNLPTRLRSQWHWPASGRTEVSITCDDTVEAMSGPLEREGPLKGLRVRMGVATGVVPRHVSPAASAVMDQAQIVSTAGWGGQVLCCATTFAAIQQSCQELAMVAAEGPQHKRQTSLRWPWRRKSDRDRDEAVLLDMGQYMYVPEGSGVDSERLILEPGFNQCASERAAVVPPSSASAVAAMVRGMMRGSTALQTAQTTPEARRLSDTSNQADGDAGADRQKGAGPASSSGHMRVYQVLGPELVQRGRRFGSELCLAPSWLLVDAPYFAAPAAHHHLLHPDDVVPLPLLQAPPPHVALAFAAAESAKTYAVMQMWDVADVRAAIAAAAATVIRQIPGGYLLRTQASDLRYIAAFPTPAAAIEWCLAMQEVLLYLPWPLSALRHWPTERDMQSGQLLFRGPRLKMGVCEGVVRSVMPDYSGRADYLGDCVNMAARFMDAAAHGGQIAVPQELAATAARVWAEVPPPCAPVAGEDRPPHMQQQSSRALDAAPDAAGRLPPAAMPQVPAGGAAVSGSNGAAPPPLCPPDVRIQIGLPSSPTAVTPSARSGTVSKASLRAGQSSMDVVAESLGRFRFKGMPTPVMMASVSCAHLSARSFPSTAPHGKGERLDGPPLPPLSSTLLHARAPRLAVVDEYKQLGLGALREASQDTLGRHSFASRVMSWRSELRQTSAARPD